MALPVDPQAGGPNSEVVTVLIPENTTGRIRTFAVKLALASWPERSVVLTVVQEA